MNRRRKATIINQVLAGELTTLRQLKAAVANPERALTQAQLEAMSDEQLIALIEHQTGQKCPDFDAMTDEQLDAIINQGAL